MKFFSNTLMIIGTIFLFYYLYKMYKLYQEEVAKDLQARISSTYGKLRPKINDLIEISRKIQFGRK